LPQGSILAIAAAMHAPRRVSCPSSGKAHLDAKFYAPVLTDLFDHYNLLGDGIISPESFTSTQQLIKSVISNLGHESSRTSASPKLSVSGPGAAVPFRCSATNASRCPSMPHSRQQRPGSAGLAAAGGHVVGIQGHGLAKARTPSPPPQLAKQTLQFSVAGSKFAPSRSPSLVLYGNDDADCGAITDFESFLSWQHRLLGASSKNSTEKIQRLAWLVGELDKLSTAQVKSRFWKRRHQSLKNLESEVQKSCQLEASGDIAAAARGLEFALHDMQRMVYEERIVAGSGKALATIASEQQWKYLKALKQKLGEQYTAELSKDGLTCAAYEAKLQQAAEIMSQEELAPQIERLKQMQACFKLRIVTLSGSEVTLDVSRLETVTRIKEKLAAELDVWAYRLNLSSEAGEVLVDNKTLEDYGIIGVGSMLFMVVTAQQMWREMSHKDFLELLVSKGLESRHNLTHVLKVDPAPPDSDVMAFRQRYISRLEEIDKKEELQRQRKEQQEQTRQSIIAQAQMLREKLGDASAAAEMASLVSAAEAETSEQAQKCRAMREDVQRDLDEALPALDAAVIALHALHKRDICEVRAFCRPPQAVVTVFEAVCILLGQKPTWDSAKKLLSDCSFLGKLLCFDKDNIPAVVIEKLQRYIDSDDFVPDRIRMCSHAAAAMCMWVRAMDTYDRVRRILEPMRQALWDAEQQVEDLLVGVHCWQECLGSARAAADAAREDKNDFQGAVTF